MTEVTHAQVSEAIQRRFASEWTATGDGSIYLRNEYPQKAEEHVRLSVLEADDRQPTFGLEGMARRRITGVLFVQIFVKRNTGKLRLDELSDSAKGIFRGLAMRNPPVQFGAVGTSYDSDEDYHWATLSIEFHYDSLIARPAA